MREAMDLLQQLTLFLLSTFPVTREAKPPVQDNYLTTSAGFLRVIIIVTEDSGNKIYNTEFHQTAMFYPKVTLRMRTHDKNIKNVIN
jgi:hypothetical protein